MAKILVFCSDVVGQSMAGPAIRYWEFAKALSKQHEVILMVPNQPDISSNEFLMIQKTKHYHHDLKQVDIIISQVISIKMAYYAKVNGIKFILDVYDPVPFETLEFYKTYPNKTRLKLLQHQINAFHFYFRMADGAICANDCQRNLWIGMMLGMNKITPDYYDQDPSFHKKISIVPFGLSSTPPKHSGNGIRAMFNLKKEDKIILWGGGIWNWFDPLTLIHAIHQINQVRSDIHLVFMGIKHPNDSIPEMKMSYEALKLAKELNLLDRHVFVNYSWVPYEQRANFLLEADIGVSTHFEHLETQYSFRTRLLDYIWAELPIVATSGDSFAKLIISEEIGLVVPPCDVPALVSAILQVIDNEDLAKKMKKNLFRIKEKFYWENVTEPIQSMIESFNLSKDKKITLKEYKNLFSSILRANIIAAFKNKIKGFFNFAQPF